MTRPLLFIGTSNLDSVFFGARLPVTGESLMGRIADYGGGKGANQAVAAARLGAAPLFASLLGDDEAGTRLTVMLTEAGVRPEKLRHRLGATTGRALIFVGETGANMIGIDAGANETFTASDVDEALSGVSSDAVLVAEMGLPTAACRAIFARKGGRFLIFNPAPVRERLKREDCTAIDILTPNETEAEALTGQPVREVEQARVAAGLLLEAGARAVVITMGARGVVYRDAKRSLHQRIYPVEAVDTTAAGDAFNGGLATAIARGMEIDAALRFGVCVACLSVTRKGAQSSMPSLGEVEEFMRKNGN